jgi:hypothetical protein
MFSNNYNMYFHKVNDSNWDINSYIKINQIEKMDDLLYLFNKIKNYTSGMFFIMKDDIKPIYEDKRNINGGVWTFKLSKKYCNVFWKEICLLFCKNELTNKKEDGEIINGLSISPKINNIILKIWISKAKNINILKKNIKNLYVKDALYRSHLRNI